MHSVQLFDRVSHYLVHKLHSIVQVIFEVRPNTNEKSDRSNKMVIIILQIFFLLLE